MAYDEDLAARVRELVPAGTPEMKMFGGLAFMVNTHMAVGLSGDGLLVRVEDPDAAAARGAEQMMMGERVMNGFMRVPGPAVATDAALEEWVVPAVAQARARPPKPPKK